jgi:hypothetical protein
MLDEWGGVGGAVALGLLLGGVWLLARGTWLEGSKRSTSSAERPRAGAAADALLRVVHSELERGSRCEQALWFARSKRSGCVAGSQ